MVPFHARVEPEFLSVLLDVGAVHRSPPEPPLRPSCDHPFSSDLQPDCAQALG